MKIKLLIITLFLFTFNSFAYDVIVKGNTKTKTSYIKKVALRCIAEDSSESFVQQCLFDEKIFSFVEVKTDGSKYSISVEDRWTLIPVPILQTDGDSTSLGGVVIDTNFLGRKNKLISGFVYSSSGSSAFAIYSNPYFLNDEFLLTAFAGLSRSEHEVYDKEIVQYKTSEKNTRLSLIPAYKITHNLNFGIGLSLNLTSYEQVDNYTPIKDSDRYSIIETLTYDNRKFKLFFQEGIASRTILSQVLAGKGNNKEIAIDTTFMFEKVTFKENAIQLKVNYYKDFNAGNNFSKKIGSKIGTRGLYDEGIWAHESFSAAVDFQIKVKENSNQIFTVAPFYDFGAFDNVFDTDSDNTYQAYGVGTYMYLRKIALPAVGFLAGYNTLRNETFFKFVIGTGI